mmetsp:Transcript_14776/g.30132  ORF Transcript_14776/g.30132 Transcript_14776/m.30132 type:complete len:372 (-) Transcript_14776:26-1141(-)
MPKSGMTWQWNFLLPGSGTHTFQWTGSNAFVDSQIVKMSRSTHPYYTYSFQGHEIRLERKPGTTASEPVKWKLLVDGRMVEEHKLSKDGNRDFKSAQEGSYQIATHFTPVCAPQAVYVFLVQGKSYNVTVGHDHVTGRVELTLDNKLISGRTYKILDNGIKLKFTAGTVPGVVSIRPSMFSFQYECFCNDVLIQPCHTKSKGAIDVDPVDVAVANPKGIVGDANSLPRRASGIGWNAEALQDTSFEAPPAEQKDDDDDDDDDDEEAKQLPPSESKSYEDSDSDSESKLASSQPTRKTVTIPVANPSQGGRPSAYDRYEPSLPRGVSLNEHDNTYTCGLMLRGKFLNLGTFDTVEEAAEAYQRGVAKYKPKR